MKTIKFVDYFEAWKQGGGLIGEILDKHHIQYKLTDKPDYIIHFPYGDDYLNYDGIRIFWTGEDISPDFNLNDYAIGFDYINFGDRYCRYPLYLQYVQDWERALNKHVLDINSIKKRKFCNFVYSNASADKERTDFYNLLSEYKRVDSGGRYMNNTGSPVQDKYAFQKNYKFSIAFENASTPGYTTEKIVEAFAAGTIPIYWGNPLIHLEFNTKAFVNCHDYNSFEEVIEVIKRIDSNDEILAKYLKEPMLTTEQRANVEMIQNSFEKFIINIFNQPYEKAYRRNRGCWGRIYEEKMRNQLLEMDVRKMKLKTLLNIIKCYIVEKWIAIRHNLHLIKVELLKTYDSKGC